MCPLVFLTVASISQAAAPGFTVEDDGQSFTIREAGKPVMVYHHAPVEPPEGVDERYRRACYFHPVYGVDGEIMTQDFPDDHYHHRGVFWTWPEGSVGGRRIDVWSLDGARHHTSSWSFHEISQDRIVLELKNYWAFDEAPNDPQIYETVFVTVHPAAEDSRSIDVHLIMSNATDETVTFLGAEGKGYGGFCFRPDATRKPLQFTTASGPIPEGEDHLRFDTPWADVSYRVRPEAATPVSGAAIFQHPSNPGYPHPGWIFRHYGFLGASWPHEQTHVIEPGESFELRYRLFLHRGSAEEAGVADAFAAYTAELTGQRQP